LDSSSGLFSTSETVVSSGSLSTAGGVVVNTTSFFFVGRTVVEVGTVVVLGEFVLNVVFGAKVVMQLQAQSQILLRTIFTSLNSGTNVKLNFN
jgi:hypothetical protein